MPLFLIEPDENALARASDPLGGVASEDRDEHDDNERGSERTCVATRTRLPVDVLIRFVVDPDGKLVPDLRRRLPGRGVWVEARQERVEAAIKIRAFARGLKRQVEVDPELPALIDRLMSKRALEALGLANKAGSVVMGFAKVEAVAAKTSTLALIHAHEAAPDGCRKIDRKLASGRLTVRIFTSDELSLALGRSNVVHAALIKGGASEKFLEEAERLMRYRLPTERQ
jgi:uncharacterized protein